MCLMKLEKKIANIILYELTEKWKIPKSNLLFRFTNPR